MGSRPQSCRAGRAMQSIEHSTAPSAHPAIRHMRPPCRAARRTPVPRASQWVAWRVQRRRRSWLRLKRRTPPTPTSTASSSASSGATVCGRVIRVGLRVCQHVGRGGRPGGSGWLRVSGDVRSAVTLPTCQAASPPASPITELLSPPSLLLPLHPPLSVPAASCPTVATPPQSCWTCVPSLSRTRSG